MEAPKVIVDVFFGLDMILSAGLKHAPARSRRIAEGFGSGSLRLSNGFCGLQWSREHSSLRHLQALCGLNLSVPMLRVSCRHYLKGQFLVDFLSTVPIDRIVEAGTV